jgi:hypothetical protein
MSAGLRDQRIRVFDFSDTSTDGRASSGYTYRDEYWGGVSAPSMREATVAGQGEHVADAVFTLERGVQVQSGGLLKADDRYYKVTGLPPANRMANEIKVFATYVDDAGSYNITGEPA